MEETKRPENLPPEREGAFARWMLRLEARWESISRRLTLVSGFVMLLMTLTVVADVTRRYFFNNPIAGAVESLSLMMPYAIYFGMAYTLATGGHVRVTLLLLRLSPKGRVYLEILSSLLTLFLLGVLVYFGWLQFWESFAMRELMMATVSLPWWIGKFGMPVGFAAFFVQALLKLLLDLGRLAGVVPLTKKIAEDQVLQTG